MIEFNSIGDHNCVLVDGTTVRMLGETRYKQFLTQRPFRARDYRQASLKEDKWLRRTLELLSRLIAYDFAVVDVDALECAGVDPIGQDLIRITKFPRQLISDVAEQIDSGVSFLEYQGHASWLDDDASANKWFDHTDKRFADRLSRVPSRIQRSNQSPARAFLYLELAKAAGVPLFLSPTKQGLLETVTREMHREVLRLVQEKVDRPIQQELKKRLSEAFTQDLDFQFPPLSRLILRRAQRKRMPLLDCALEMRDSDEAQAFRAWLKDLSRLLDSRSVGASLTAASAIGELEDLVASWLQAENLEEGVTRQTRRLKLGKLPTVGWLFELSGVDEKGVSDFVLKPNPVYKFIASWYEGSDV